MIVIRCHECKRKYNWAGDAFCPHCGAFNQAQDYSFDRERIEVTLEDSDKPEVLFQRKKTATGQANNAPNRPIPNRKPVEPSMRAEQKKTDDSKNQASGCLKKIIIAVIIWNIATVGLGIMANLLYSAF